jgi:tetratricopeptide (TPR) repeat protein
MISDPEPHLHAKAICRAGGLELIQGNLAGPPELVREALQIFKDLDDKEGMAWCLNLLGQTCTFANVDVEDGLTYLTQSLELFRELGDEWGMAWSNRYLGQLAEFQDDIEHAFTLQEEALNVFKDIGDFWNAAHSLFLIGGTYRDQGDFNQAENAYRECYEMCEMIDDHVMGAHALQGLGIAALELGRHDDAEIHLHEALEIMLRIGDENCTARVNHYLARIALHDGDYSLASTHLEESVQIYKKLKRDAYIGMCLTRYAELAEIAGQHSRAARLLGAALTLSAEASAPLAAILISDVEAQVEKVREVMGENDYERAYNEGTRMALEEAVAYALKEISFP